MTRDEKIAVAAKGIHEGAANFAPEGAAVLPPTWDGWRVYAEHAVDALERAANKESFVGC